MNFDKIIDILMFREASEEDSHTTSPKITTGSIVWGVILRSAIIIFLSMIIIQKYDLYSYWWYSLFALWFLAAWPAYRQYQSFSKRMEKFTESTLCGQCRHFDSSGQLCRIYDEHVSSDYIPCDGDSWEPRQ